MDSLKSKNQIHPTTTTTTAATTTTTTTTSAPTQSQANPTGPNQEQRKHEKPLPLLGGQGPGPGPGHGPGHGQEKSQLQYILNKKRGISQIEKVGNQWTRIGNPEPESEGSSNKSGDRDRLDDGKFVANSERKAEEKRLGVSSQSRFLSLGSSPPFSNYSFRTKSTGTGTGTGTGADTLSTVSTIFTNLAGLERFDDTERLFASVVLVPLKDKDVDLRKELELLSLRLPVPLSPSTMTWVKFFKVFNQQGEHIFSAGEVKDPWANPFKNKWHFLLYVFTSEGEPIFTIAQRNDVYCRRCRCRCRSDCGWKCTFTCCSYKCRRGRDSRSPGHGHRGPSSDPEYDWLTHKEADTYLNRKFGAANLHGIRIRSTDFETDKEGEGEEKEEEELDYLFEEEEERFPGEGQCHIHVSLLNGLFLGHIWVGLDSYTIHDLEYNPVLTVQRSHRGEAPELHVSFQSVESVAQGGGQNDIVAKAKSGENISVQRRDGEAQNAQDALQVTTEPPEPEPDKRRKLEGKKVEIKSVKNKLYYSLYMEAAEVGSIRNDLLLKEFGNQGQTRRCISAQFPLFFDQEDKALILAFILSQEGILAEPCSGSFCRLFVTPYSITCFVLFLLVVALIVGLVLWKLDLL